jgi:peptide/nickel transport system permease protein
MLVFVAGLAVTGAFLPHESAIRMDPASRFAAPSSAHLLGADELGRDILSRLARGAEVTIAMALAILFVALCLGWLLGRAAREWPSSLGRLVRAGAYLSLIAPSQLLAPPWSSRILMALCCTMLVLPGALLVVAAAAFSGPGPITSVAAIGLFLTPAFAYAAYRRPMSTETVAIPEEFRPAPLPLLATSVFAWGALTSIGLDYTGLGVQPSLESLGALLRPSGAGAPIAWSILYPALCVLLTVLGAFLLGDRFRDRKKA